MAIQKIDIFAPPRSRYQALHYMTECLLEAFLAKGIQCRLYDSQSAEAPVDFLNNFLSDKPDLTLSFNGLLPDDQGIFFCDMVEVPHVALLVDSPPHFFPLTQSPRTLITTIDRFFVDFFQGFGDKKALFCPHASGGKNPQDPSSSHDLDVVMLGSFEDPEKIRKEWKHPQDLCGVMEETAAMTLKTSDKSFVECFTLCLNKLVGLGKVDVSSLNFAEILIDIEDYVRAIDRQKLIQSLAGLKVDVFGEGDWKSLAQEGLTVHPAVNFKEGLEIMGRAKVVLNSTAHIKNGSHERFFEAFVQGALPLSSPNLYLQERFQDCAPFYQNSEAKEQVLEILTNEPERVKMVTQGQERVLKEDLWSNRAQILLDQLPPLLAKLF